MFWPTDQTDFLFGVVIVIEASQKMIQSVTCLLSYMQNAMKLQKTHHYPVSEKNDGILQKIRTYTPLMKQNLPKNLPDIVGISYSILAACTMMTQAEPAFKGNLAKLQYVWKIS